MSRKLVLAPVALESAKSLATSFVTDATIISYQDNIAYQINVDTSDSEGTFAVEASLDYDERLNTGTWTELTLSGVPTVAAADDSILISMAQVPYKALRMTYTSTVAGTGTCDILIMAKTVGA